MKQQIKKPMIIMLVALGILFGGIFIYKVVMGMLMKHFFASMSNPTVTVSTTTAKYDKWQPELKSVGSLRAIVGVNVTAQLSGMIQNIYFTPGATVIAGATLVQQNADTEIARLHSLEAQAELAKITYTRDKAQYAVHAISKQQLDTDEQNLRSLRAQVEEQRATVDKLTIRAPFSGRLGISQVNPGQFLNPGDKIVTLQRLDPIYVDFYLPQQTLAQLEVGQEVIVKNNTFPKDTFKGKITTIDPVVDVNTRNVEIEATMANPNNRLTPGMFVNVQVRVSKPKPYLTLPQSAISFNSYGDIVYIVKDTGKKDGNDQPLLVANQVFVVTEDTRGDQITIVKGVKEGDVVVTSGQLKLKNGSHVKINNSIVPSDSANPLVPNEHDG